MPPPFELEKDDEIIVIEHPPILPIGLIMLSPPLGTSDMLSPFSIILNWKNASAFRKVSSTF